MIPRKQGKIKRYFVVFTHFSPRREAGAGRLQRPLQGSRNNSLSDKNAACFMRRYDQKGFVSDACKPSSVIGGHLSRPIVTGGFKRNPESLTGRLKRSFVSCSEWGLHRGQVARPRVSSYLTFPPLHAHGMRYLSVALSLGSPPPGVTRHSALWSSDFPHTFRRAAARQPHKRSDYSILSPACQRYCIKSEKERTDRSLPDSAYLSRERAS